MKNRPTAATKQCAGAVARFLVCRCLTLMTTLVLTFRFVPVMNYWGMIRLVSAIAFKLTA